MLLKFRFRLWNMLNSIANILFNKIPVHVEIVDPIYYEYPPKYETDGSAGVDLRACIEEESIHIYPGEVVKVSSGLKIAIPEGYVGLLAVRSGKSTKGGLRTANQLAIIDSDYRGIVHIACCTHNPEGCKIERGERIAQILFSPVHQAKFIPCCDVAKEYPTARGARGFGHTGEK